MPAWMTAVLFGGVAVIVFDALGAAGSRALGFDYSLLVVGSILIYGWVGAQVVRRGGSQSNALAAGLLVGLVDAIIGWIISWRIGPGRPGPNDPQGLPFIVGGVVTALIIAALVASLGAWLARRRTRRAA
jgi:hypothetical protein